MGAGVETTDGRLPLAIQGRPLHGDRLRAAGGERAGEVGVLLAGLYAERRDDGRRAGADARPHRADARRGRRAASRVRPTSVTIWPAERLALGEVEVPGDFSSAAPFLVAATLFPGSELHVHGVNLNPRRTGLLARARAHGRATSPSTTGARSAASRAATSTSARPSCRRRRSAPTRCRSRSTSCRSSRSRRRAPAGDSRLRGAAELRAKETDRIEATVDAAARARGARRAATEDGFAVRGVPTRLRGGRDRQPRRPPHRDARRRRRARLARGRRDRGARLRRQ